MLKYQHHVAARNSVCNRSTQIPIIGKETQVTSVLTEACVLSNFSVAISKQGTLPAELIANQRSLKVQLGIARGSILSSGGVEQVTTLGKGTDLIKMMQIHIQTASFFGHIIWNTQHSDTASQEEGRRISRLKAKEVKQGRRCSGLKGLRGNG
jgi:hypothetical protein